MSKVTALTEIDAVADNDVMYIWDASTPSAPDKKVPFSKLRPSGVRITNNFRYEGNITIPALAAGVEGDATIAIAGAAVGDHLVFNLTAALPGNIAVLHAWVSAADTATVRFRNTHAANAYAGAAIACVALASRSV
jgi:hypothetical protein